MRHMVCLLLFSANPLCDVFLDTRGQTRTVSPQRLKINAGTERERAHAHTHTSPCQHEDVFRTINPASGSQLEITETQCNLYDIIIPKRLLNHNITRDRFGLKEIHEECVGVVVDC